MGNINSIVDINGKTMVKYYYNTFCEPVIITLDETDEDYNLSLALSKCNVFLYKGYIYDVETNLALVSSRYYSPELGRFIQPADVSTLNPHSINGVNLYAYANNNPIGKAKSSSITNLRILSDLGTTMMIPTSKIPIVNSNVGNINYWDPHVKGKWFDTDVPEFFNFTHDKIEFVNWSFSVFKGGLYFDHNENHSLYIAGGNISTYFGISSDGVGLDLGANVLEIGYDGRIIDANLEVLTAGLTFMYKEGTFEFGIGAVWFGYSVTIDIDEIIKIIFGG